MKALTNTLKLHLFRHDIFGRYEHWEYTEPHAGNPGRCAGFQLKETPDRTSSEPRF